MRLRSLQKVQFTHYVALVVLPFVLVQTLRPGRNRSPVLGTFDSNPDEETAESLNRNALAGTHAESLSNLVSETGKVRIPEPGRVSYWNRSQVPTGQDGKFHFGLIGDFVQEHDTSLVTVGWFFIRNCSTGNEAPQGYYRLPSRWHGDDLEFLTPDNEWTLLATRNGFEMKRIDGDLTWRYVYRDPSVLSSRDYELDAELLKIRPVFKPKPFQSQNSASLLRLTLPGVTDRVQGSTADCISWCVHEFCAALRGQDPNGAFLNVR